MNAVTAAATESDQTPEIDRTSEIDQPRSEDHLFRRTQLNFAKINTQLNFANFWIGYPSHDHSSTSPSFVLISKDTKLQQTQQHND